MIRRIIKIERPGGFLILFLQIDTEIIIRNRPSQWGICIIFGIVIIKDFLEPLEKLQVVLVLALDESLYLNMFHNAELGEILLEDFKIVYVFVVIFCLEINLRELHFAWVEQVEHLTV